MIEPPRTSGFVERATPSVRSRVRRREDLLGRDVRHVDDPVDRLEARRHEAARRQQPDDEVGAGALEVQRVEAALGQPLAGADERVGALAPRGDRVVGVEAADVDELVDELRERGVVVEVGVDQPRPRQARAGADAPVGRARR